MGLPYPQNILCANLIGGLPRRDQVKAGFVLGLFQNSECVHVGVAGCVCVCVCDKGLQAKLSVHGHSWTLSHTIWMAIPRNAEAGGSLAALSANERRPLAGAGGCDNRGLLHRL